MKIRNLDRREFLASLATLTVLPACGSDEDGSGGSGGAGGGPGPEPPAWDAPGTHDATAFAWSIQTGDATPSAVMVSLRTTESNVTLTVMRGVEGGWEEVSRGTTHTPVDGVVWRTGKSRLRPRVWRT